MNDLMRKKKRLRLTLLAAAWLGCGSAAMSGSMTMLSWSAPPHALAPAMMA